ncbi:hypothetical protein DesfrDRAFT_0834 [Solidesulfovibrio fructosivorans JJ]]|uniref:DNA primase n=1 Tax=Solidesulfovibrio fructosivorans JJ] TaxID=596151 RepID=E1JT85_SOLFR|nr:hypothetical protein [Solidesulfovibrio fructosivorans]EFL52345.1 hypothetical protein DesfrDRAFT_0834 [Solidesulfovibrio fructosivorans JJ]]
MLNDSYKNLIDKINSKYSLIDYLSDLDTGIKNKSGNYTCPLCGHDSFSVFEDTTVGLCHCKSGSCTCSFKGDIFSLYLAKNPKKKFTDAIKYFSSKVNIDYIEELELTKNLKWQLDYLAKCRQYLAFYNLNASDIMKNFTSINCENEDFAVNSKRFYSVLKGNIESYSMMYKVVTILRTEITDEKLERYEKDRIRNDYHNDQVNQYYKERNTINAILRELNIYSKYYKRFD